MSSPPPDPQAPWYEKAFKVQSLGLLVAVAVAGPAIAFMNLRQPPRVPPWFIPAMKVFLAVAAPVVCGGLAIQMFRHILWLFGRGPFVATWIGPPSRANCVIMGLGALACADVAFEKAAVIGAAATSVMLLAVSFMFFLGLTGYLWAQAEARKPRPKETT